MSHNADPSPKNPNQQPPDLPEEIKQSILRAIEEGYSLTYQEYGGEAGKNEVFDPYAGYAICQVLCHRVSERLKEIPDTASLPIESRSAYTYADNVDENGEPELFSHTYLTIEYHDGYILVDPTYLQFVSKEDRTGCEPALLVYYRTNEELMQAIKDIPFDEKYCFGYYLGFNSPEFEQLVPDKINRFDREFKIENDRGIAFDDSIFR